MTREAREPAGGAGAVSRPEDSLDLVRRFQRGEESALDELFRRYYGRVGRMARIRCWPHRDILDPEDITHDVFMIVQRKLRNFDVREHAQLFNWLATLVTNKVREELSRRFRDRRDHRRTLPMEAVGVCASGSNTAWEPSAHGPSPASRVGRRELDGCVDECVAALEESARELILLRDYARGSWEYVAQQLGLASAESARKRYFRVKLQLGRMLAERGVRSSGE